VLLDKPVVFENLFTEQDCAPWRAEAIQRGISSAVILPLVAGGQTLGALGLFAEDPEAGSAERVALLREIVDDLARGMLVLRERAACAPMLAGRPDA
jgi:GAF domain-containing protein